MGLCVGHRCDFHLIQSVSIHKLLFEVRKVGNRKLRFEDFSCPSEFTSGSLQSRILGVLGYDSFQSVGSGLWRHKDIALLRLSASS